MHPLKLNRALSVYTVLGYLSYFTRQKKIMQNMGKERCRKNTERSCLDWFAIINMFYVYVCYGVKKLQNIKNEKTGLYRKKQIGSSLHIFGNTYIVIKMKIGRKLHYMHPICTVAT